MPRTRTSSASSTSCGCPRRRRLPSCARRVQASDSPQGSPGPHPIRCGLPQRPSRPMTLRRPSPQQDPAPKRRAADVAYEAIVRCAENMVQAAARGHLDDYMLADHELDLVTHQASQNHSAVKCVQPLIVQCSRFWYAYQHEGEVSEGARAHMQLAQGIASGDEAQAIAGAEQLMEYLERFARRIIDR